MKRKTWICLLSINSWICLRWCDGKCMACCPRGTALQEMYQSMEKSFTFFLVIETVSTLVLVLVSKSGQVRREHSGWLSIGSIYSPMGTCSCSDCWNILIVWNSQLDAELIMSALSPPGAIFSHFCEYLQIHQLAPFWHKYTLYWV